MSLFDSLPASDLGVTANIPDAVANTAPVEEKKAESHSHPQSPSNEAHRPQLHAAKSTGHRDRS